MWISIVLSYLKSNIHPSIVFHLSQVGSWWQKAKKDITDVLLPIHTFLFLLRISKVFPVQMRYTFGSTSPPPSWACPEDLQKKLLGRPPSLMSKPPQLARFDIQEQHVFSKIPPKVWHPRPISKAEPPFGCLYSWPYSFGHHSYFMTMQRVMVGTQ